MSESDFPLHDHDDLDREINLDADQPNQRMAVRYRRTDLRAAIKVHSLLFPRLFQVALYDISSRGAAVISQDKLSRKSKVSLYLMFPDGERFDVVARVVHCDHKKQRYGLKFDGRHAALAEHLLHTQTDLHFS